MSTLITQDIPKDKWAVAFKDASRRYRGWMAFLEALEGELGDQSLAKYLPLQGISYEVAGSQAGDIIIEVGDAGTPFQTHLVNRPRVARLARTLGDVEADFEFETDDDVTLILRLRRRLDVPLLPPEQKQ